MKAGFGNHCIANDECYSPEKTAEYVVSKYIKLLECKKVILPCDCEWSELYKACKRHNIDCDIAQDMYNVDYSKYDLVFTNPPFSGLYKYLKWLDEQNIKFLVFAPWAIVQYCAAHNKQSAHYFYHKVFYLEDFAKDLVAFNKPDGTTTAVHWGLVTNLDEGKTIVEAKPDIRIEPTEEYTEYRGIWYDITKCNYLKYNYLCTTKLYVRKA